MMYPLPNFQPIDSKPSIAIPTGFPQLDEGLNGGLQLGRAYLIASVEKSGKTSYLRKMLYQMALSRTIVGMIDVEQQEDFFIRAITCLWANKKIVDVTTEETTQTRQELEDRFVYVNRINGANLIANDLGEIEVEKCIETFERMIDERGVQVCVFDNVTPLASEGSKASSNQRMMMMNSLCSLAKRKNVIVIVVGHVNSSTQDLMTDNRIKDVLSGHSDPSTMMQDSVITVRRPTTKEVYGGSILTQFDAKIRTQIDL